MMINSQPLAVVKKIELTEPSHVHFGVTTTLLNSFLFPVQVTTEFDVIHVDQIVEKCVFIHVADSVQYVCTFPNQLCCD